MRYNVFLIMKKSQKPYLTRLRENAGLSLRELANLLKTHWTNLAYWERSGRPPKSDLLLPMAKILGVNVEELLGVPKPAKKQQLSAKKHATNENR